MNNNYSVVLVDDHELVRAGIRSLLNTIADIKVVGECGDGLEVLGLLRQHQPDILILDISIKSMNGMDVLSLIEQEHIDVKILMLSMHNNIEYIAKCLRAGAHGYLLKDAAVDELEPAIRHVLQGKTYISHDVDDQVLEKILLNDVGKSSPLELLTLRQKQILQLIAEGYSTRQIADATFISVKTVETHRSHIMSRLQIFDIAGLVRFAMQEQLIL